MIVTIVRIDGFADHMNKKPDFIIKTQNNHIGKYHSQNSTRDSLDDSKTQ